MSMVLIAPVERPPKARTVLDTQVTFQKRITGKVVKPITVQQVVDLIRGNDYREKIEAGRDAYKKGDKGAYKEVKDALPAVTFSGEFRAAGKAGLVQHSGLLVVDFDGLALDQIERAKDELGRHPATVLVFISPSGCGIKWVVAVDATEETSHRGCFDAVVREVAEKFPKLTVDPSGKDVCRRCFVSFDPGIIVKAPTGRYTPLRTVTVTDFGKPARCETDLQTSGRSDLRNGSHLPLSSTPSPGSPIAGEGQLNPNDPKLRDRIKELAPVAISQTDAGLFRLGRLCRDLERELGLDRFQLSKNDQRTVINLWLEVTPNEFRRHSDSDYRDEFTQKFLDAKLGITSVPWRIAWERSRTEPPPSWWHHVIEDPEPKRLRLLAMLSIQAQLTGGIIIAPLDLIVTAAKDEGFVELDHPAKVHRVLKGFRPTLDRITKASKTPTRAAEYRLNVPNEWVVGVVEDSPSAVPLSPAEIIL